MASLLVSPSLLAGVLVNSVFNLQAPALFVVGRHWTVFELIFRSCGLLGCGTILLVLASDSGIWLRRIVGLRSLFLIYARTTRSLFSPIATSCPG